MAGKVGALKNVLTGAFDMVNNAGKKLFGNHYLPYDLAQTDVKSTTASDFLKNHVIKFFIDEPSNLIDTDARSLRDIPIKDIADAMRNDQAFNYQIGVQGLAHGVDASGRPLHLNNVSEILNRPTTVIANTDMEKPYGMWMLTPDNKSLEQIIAEALKE